MLVTVHKHCFSITSRLIKYSAPNQKLSVYKKRKNEILEERGPMRVYDGMNSLNTDYTKKPISEEER